MEWTIQEVARLAGTTSRTLRHYGERGLLEPSRVGANGYRHYDEAALVRLQRILLLRQLGLGLDQIHDVLTREVTETDALTVHLDLLRAEQERLRRQIAAVEGTIRSRQKEEPLMAEKMFDGFDHTQYRDEVEEKWGAEAADASDAWWSAMDAPTRQDWLASSADLATAWTEAARAGIDPAGAEAQALAARHVAWLRSVPGTPAAKGGDISGYVRGLAEMYVADVRFAATYGGATGAAFVRDALHIHVAD